MRSGYEIARELFDTKKSVGEIIRDNHGEITDRVYELLEELDELELEAKEKIEAYVYVIRQLRESKSPYEGLKEYHYGEYKDAHEKIKSIDKNEDRVKEYILKLFDVLGERSIGTETGSVFTREHESTDIGELSDDEKDWLVEHGYASWSLSIDKNKILSDLKENGEFADKLKLLPINTATKRSVGGI